MIIFSIGLPGRFAEFCDALILSLAERSLGSVATATLDTLDEVACASIKTESAHLVATSRHPVVRLQTEIMQAGRPFLLALGDVDVALLELLQRPGHDVPIAT